MRAIGPLLLALAGFFAAAFFAEARAQVPGAADLGFVEKVLTLYGPLGLGWVAFAWERWRNSRIQDQLLAAFQDNTKANTLLAERLAGTPK